MTKNEKFKKNRIGITWKMFAILILFVTVVVSISWFFQIQTMTYFYQLSRFRELEDFSKEISSSISEIKEGDEEAKEVSHYLEEYAGEHFIDVWIFEVSDGIGNPLMKIDGNGGGMNIPFIDRKIESLYSEAKDNDGVYIATVPFDHSKNDISLEVIDDNKNGAEDYPIVIKKSADVCAMYATVTELEGKEYLSVQFSRLTPVSAMVETLRYQFVWNGICLGIFALITAVIMSKLITKPFVRMNDAAKRLAEGKYDVDFSGKGYREINELADTLNYASRELSKNDNLQKELISNISHDLRTPLTMIKGYSEMMRDIPGENNSENAQIIIEETERLSELVNDMLDLSKISSGTRKPDYEIFCITETVRETLTRYEKLVMQEGLIIRFEFDKEVDIKADRVMILQVIYNLINNAVNYSGSEKRVTVTQSEKDGRVRIIVSDSGEGIDAADIPYIWDRYYRVDRVHKRATVGTGLGLSIVKGILELHGATYGVESELGKGSNFWFELDVASEETGYAEFATPTIIDTDYEEDADKNEDS
ncbi:MAG: HAMP domain-containing histidine kinase [Clostridia bacterium]|nr:HAMP domain-containing histidine kinase [Clostridia bacterium]